MTYYLAYGMNTNLLSMAQRCPAARSLGKVILNNHKLSFRHFCDIEYKQGHNIECALWSISDDCERSLDRLEGYPEYYLKKEVDVIFQDKKIKAMIYYMADRYALSLPSEYYFQMVLEGYQSHGMNTTALFTAIDDVSALRLQSVHI